MNVLVRQNFETSPVQKDPGTDRDFLIFQSRAALSRILSKILRVPYNDLMSNDRGSHDVARVRNLAVYILHVQFGMSFALLGRAFDRNRSTVKFACQQVEDMRDDEGVDFLVECISRAVLDWVELMASSKPKESV